MASCQFSHSGPSGFQPNSLNFDQLITNLAPLANAFLNSENTGKSAEIVQRRNDGFKVFLDVSQFKVEEIKVRVIGEQIIQVEAKQEEKEDEHGSVFRHFVRKYKVPEVYDLAKIESKLTPDGQLKIVVPVIGDIQRGDKEIPIMRE